MSYFNLCYLVLNPVLYVKRNLNERVRDETARHIKRILQLMTTAI